MARNYNLNEDDYDNIYNQWNDDAHEKYGVDFNGVWYKNEDDERN